MTRRNTRPAMLLATLLTCTTTSAAGTRGISNSPHDMQSRTDARATYAGLKRTYVADDLRNSFRNRIEVKFREGRALRAREGALVLDTSQARDTAARVEWEQVRAVLGGVRRSVAMKMHPFTESVAQQLKAEGERLSGQPLPDPNLWFYLYLDAASDQVVADTLTALNALDGVEVAYPSPLPVAPPSMDRASAAAFEAPWREQPRLDWPTPEHVREWERGQDATLAEAPPLPRALTSPAPNTGAGWSLTASYTADQDYGEAAPVGIDTDWLRSHYWNAYGDGWGYTDVEYAWNRSHQDITKLAGAVLVNGTTHASANLLSTRDHGSAVTGLLSSDLNAFGTTGLVTSAAVRLSTEFPTTGQDRPSAIYAAANQFWPGAVILLEMQAYNTFDCNGDRLLDANDLVPSEVVPAVRDAIKVATANGRIVVEAAGNGNCNLDLPAFNGYFSAVDPAMDSGAIIVGAAEKFTGNKASFSTYGSRVDTQSEGDWHIVTTGYGDLYNAEGENLSYTRMFAGTSGASPIVTGAAVALSSVMYLRYGSIYAPRELRDVLRRDGTPQGAGGHVGPRPDLRKQIAHMQNRYPNPHSTDFDGDGRSDLAVWRPDSGAWIIRASATGATTFTGWGAPGDVPVPGDYTGDARAELAVWRADTGYWYVLNSDNTSIAIQWGARGDIPVPMDLTGDHKAEMVVYRPPYLTGNGSSGQWLIRYANGTSATVNWGAAGDVPLARDFDGDGYDDMTLYRPSTGQWMIRAISGAITTYTFGAWTEVPVPYKSGNQWNLAMWRPSDSTFTTRNIHGGGTSTFAYGIPGDVPRFGDLNGDGTDEYLVYRAATGTWYDSAYGAFALGLPGDLVMVR
ncbi:S8 family serine peptidase [Myxococcaceae bacterium JPH2]|nr:S8 family serine peptidase [Myxococcaceae bacterium JPH2]